MPPAYHTFKVSCIEDAYSGSVKQDPAHKKDCEVSQVGPAKGREAAERHTFRHENLNFLRIPRIQETCSLCNSLLMVSSSKTNAPRGRPELTLPLYKGLAAHRHWCQRQ